MMYAITLNGYYFKGFNHNGPVYGTCVVNAVHFSCRDDACVLNDNTVGGEVVPVPSWAWF